MRATDEILQRFALRQTAERYAVAVDRGDGALFAAQFTPDGELVAPRGVFAGRDSLSTVPAMMRGLYEKTFHAVLTQVAEIEGDEATAETYCIARHLYRDGEQRRMCYEMTIRYQDRFARLGGAWLFARRELIVDAAYRFLIEDAR
ncbi:MAG: hypothetical protein BGP06_14910 [Rhizobiales bacterium 65-9]|nr:nuclear transport factor 2 family protein [Hyphomicrobiales bacterium]OJY38285.1 MAG: hypothetical protein BGP06_14910 [Rhizobiales bacterium 65-9]